MCAPRQAQSWTQTSSPSAPPLCVLGDGDNQSLPFPSQDRYLFTEAELEILKSKKLKRDIYSRKPWPQTV